MAFIGLREGSGKRSRVREKSVKSQGILIWIMSGNPGIYAVVINGDPGLTLTYFMARSNLVTYAFL